MSSRAYKAIKSGEFLSVCPAMLEFEFVNASQKEIKDTTLLLLSKTQAAGIYLSVAEIFTVLHLILCKYTAPVGWGTFVPPSDSR